jgi:Fe-S oxidoreductase
VLGPYLRELKELFHKHNYRVSIYGHFGQGIIHCRIPFDLYTRQGIDDYKLFMEEATDLIDKYHGSYSGEHGDGQSRAWYLPKMFGETCMQAMHEFKSIWDPHWKMNPGKVIDPYSNIENMRLSPDYNPPEPATHFEYPHDMHLFSRAALRCVGVGKCRRVGDQTMCPSYMVTKEEKHSTRGRARMLWEMLNGEVLKDGWKSDEVHDALHLCLACKGCKGDCPVSVDMASYKAEFLSHYYQGRLRPRHMFAFGLIHVWSRLASLAPTIANLFTQTPGVDVLAKFAAGVDQRRKHIPAFAPRTFKSWYARHQPKNPKGPPVILFADTFHNYFHPDISQAALEVLEDAGFHVLVMEQDMCCGRPLYDYGFLNLARRRLEDIIAKMRPHIEAGTPMVVLEPSCWATFYDELTNIISGNKDADRLHHNTFLFAAFLKEHAPDYKPPKLHRKAILHRHCHQKSELKHEPNYEKQILEEMGMEVQEPETGCCGMAGAFGYTAGEEYDVSIACGERVLLPRVRESKDQTILVADGFSCREQISQETDRHALHIAQVIQLAKRYGPYGPEGRPEKPFIRERNYQLRQARKRVLTTAAVLGAGFLAGAAVYAAVAHKTKRRNKTSRRLRNFIRR